MKAKKVMAVSALVLGLYGSVLYGAEEPKSEGQTRGGVEETGPAKIGHAGNGDVVITLAAGTEKVMGLETAPLKAFRLEPQLTAYGRVLDPLPLTSLVADVAVARAAATASEAELKRLQVLSQQNNASARALQAGEAAAARDQAQLEAAQLKLLGSWGPAIAKRSDLAGFAQALGALSNALVQLNLPAGEKLEPPPEGARILTLGGQRPIEAKLVGPCPSVDPQLQTRGLLYLVAPNQARLAPGAAVTALLPLPGPPRQGVLVPRTAVVRYNGVAWIYRRSGAHTYERVQVGLEEPAEGGWFVPEGLQPGQIVVISGAQLLLSEELKGGIEE